MPINNKKCWSIKAEKMADGKSIGHLYLYGIISSVTWWGDEVTPKQLLEDIKSLGDIEKLRVHIFSDGGDVFAGMAIRSILKQQKVPVEAYIEGIAASIATVIATGAGKVYISRSAMMYYHKPMLGLCGYYNATDLEAMLQDLEKVLEPMVAAYIEQSGKTRDEILAILDGENNTGTWYTAEEAIEAGFAFDYIPEEMEVDAAACIAQDTYMWRGKVFDLSKYPNAPKIQNTKNIRRKNAMGKTKAQSTSIVDQVTTTTIEITCPACEATFDHETSSDAVVINVTCPECDEEFQWDVANSTAVNSGEDDGGEGNDESSPEKGSEGSPEEGTGTENPYEAGVKAERERIAALDSIVAAVPSSAKIIDQAKKNGTSYEEACKLVFAALEASQKKSATRAASFLDDLATDFKKSNQIGAVPTATSHQSEEDKYAAMIAQNFKK